VAAAARRLSDAEWDAICDAVAKLLPDADARAEIEHCLFVEFPAFHYDAQRVAAAYQSGRRMLKHCKALADLFAQERAFADDIKHERDLFYIERLRRRAFALVVACQRIRRANSRRANVQHEWLHHAALLNLSRQFQRRPFDRLDSRSGRPTGRSTDQFPGGDDGLGPAKATPAGARRTTGRDQARTSRA